MCSTFANVWLKERKSQQQRTDSARKRKRGRGNERISIDRANRLLHEIRPEVQPEKRKENNCVCLNKKIQANQPAATHQHRKKHTHKTNHKRKERKKHTTGSWRTNEHRKKQGKKHEIVVYVYRVRRSNDRINYIMYIVQCYTHIEYEGQWFVCEHSI